MPYIREGRCVYHRQADGSRGELIKCHETAEQAQRHLAALYANVEDAKGEQSLQDCVSRRVGRYIDEGMPREQALGRAYAECRDKDGKRYPIIEWEGEMYAVLDPDCEEPFVTPVTAVSHKLVAFGGSIKKLNEDSVGGYLVLWGDENNKDLDGEYFSPDTDLGLDWFDSRPVLYHHGLDSSLKHTRIGQIVSLKKDDVGVWVEAQLDLRNRYVQAIMSLVEKGVVGWSSGTLSYLVETEAGKIKVWPIVEGSITPTPADPRTAVIHLKALTELAMPKGLATAGLASETEPTVLTDGDEQAETPSVSSEVQSVQSTQMHNRRVGQEAVLSDTAGQQDEVKTMDPKEVALAAINATLQALHVEGVSEEDKATLVESVLAHLQNTSPATPEEAKTLGEEIGQAAIEAVKGWLAAREAAEAVKRHVAQSLQPQPAVQNSFDGRPPFVEVRSRYHNLSGEDMAFLASVWLDHPRMKNWTPSQAFMREMADKVLRREDDFTELETDPHDGQPYAIKALRQIARDGGYKANELMGPGQTGYGAEWIPDLWANQLWRRTRIENAVLGLLEKIDMPQDDWTLPIEGDDPVVYRVPVATDDAQLNPAGSTVTASKAGTSQVKLVAHKIGARVPWAREQQEDSIIPFVPEIRRKMLRAMEDAIEYCVLHADTTTGTGNINKYDATVNATDKDVWLLGFDGIAHIPLVDNTGNAYDVNGAPTVAALRTVRRLLAPELLNAMNELVYVVEPVTATKLLDISEVLTMDKFGPRATVLTGQLAAFDSIPVVISAQLRQAAINGQISATPANNTKGRILLFHRPSFRFGYRRRVTLTVAQYPESDAAQLISFARIALTRFNTDCAALGYNIAI